MRRKGRWLQAHLGGLWSGGVVTCTLVAGCVEPQGGVDEEPQVLPARQPESAGGGGPAPHGDTVKERASTPAAGQEVPPEGTGAESGAQQGAKPGGTGTAVPANEHGGGLHTSSGAPPGAVPAEKPGDSSPGCGLNPFDYEATEGFAEQSHRAPPASRGSPPATDERVESDRAPRRAISPAAPRAMSTKNFAGTAVMLSGTLILPPGEQGSGIQIDVNRLGPEGGHQSSTILPSAGEFSVPAPANAGKVILKIYLGDPQGDPLDRRFHEYGPIDVGGADIGEIEIDLSKATLTRVGEVARTGTTAEGEPVDVPNAAPGGPAPSPGGSLAAPPGAVSR